MRPAKVVTIAEVARVITGKTPSTKEPLFWDGDIPFVTPGDLQSLKNIKVTSRTVSHLVYARMAKQLLPARSICVSCIGNLGYAGMTIKPSLSNQQINSLIPHNVADADFLYYSMKGLWPFFKSFEGQSTTLSILNKTQFSKIKILWPDETVRRKIGYILNLFDSKIEYNTKLNGYLLELAMARFESALEGKSKTVRFGDIVAFEDSKRVPLNSRDREARKGPYPYYGATSVMDYVDGYLFDGIRVLLGEDGTVIDSEGRPILQYVWGKYWVNNHAHILASSGEYSLEAIYVALRRTAINHIVTGAVQMKISQRNLKSLELEMPSPKSLDYLQDLFAAYRSNRDESAKLASLRDALLPKLMSGEIDVTKVDLTQLNSHLA